jgi:hypothetical protein
MMGFAGPQKTLLVSLPGAFYGRPEGAQEPPA